MQVVQDITDTNRKRFVDEVSSVIDLPVQFDNAPFTKPTSGQWIRFETEFTLGRQTTVGKKPRRFRGRGQIVATVYSLVEQGDLANLNITTIIELAFRGVTFQGVRYLTPTVRNLGRVGKEWRTSLSCPFYKDDLL